MDIAPLDSRFHGNDEKGFASAEASPSPFEGPHGPGPRVPPQDEGLEMTRRIY